MTETTAVPVGVELDLGVLTAFDSRQNPDNSLIEQATKGTDVLVKAIFNLPLNDKFEGKFVDLPNPTFQLPREKPIPKEKTFTKWEKFAKEKGIQKKRRDRLVFDQSTGEYVPRYGRGSKNSLERDIIIPHRESMADDEDPFQTKRKEKKQRVLDNKKKQVSNVRRATKGRGPGIDPMSALDVAKSGPSGKKFLPKKSLSDSLSVVQKSTASAGKFDNKVSGERKQKSQGRKKKMTTGSSKAALGKEKKQSQTIAQRILSGKQ